MLVVHVSVAAAWLLDDEQSDLAERVLAHLANDDAVVPIIFHYEVSNVLVSAYRRGRIEEQDVTGAILRLSRLPIRAVEPPSRAQMETIWTLARDHALSAYDAAYLEVAVEYGIALATLDSRLTVAARASGVPLFA